MKLCSPLPCPAVAILGRRCSAFAADPVFPPGARVRHGAAGRPQPGQGASSDFETEDQGVKVADRRPAGRRPMARSPTRSRPIRPAPAASSRRARDPRGAGLLHRRKAQGRRRRHVQALFDDRAAAPTFSGYVAVQVPENAPKIYTDDAVRQMFATAVDPQGGPGRQSNSG